MKTELLPLENNKLQIEVTIDESEVAAALQGAYKKVVAKVNMPGFRKGKVPVHILEARYGQEVLHDDALDILLPPAYERVLTEHQVKPIARPEVTVVHFARGDAAQIKFVVELLPEIIVEEYKGVVIEKPLVEVGEDQVEKELAKLAERHVRLVDASDSALAVGDTAIIDYSGSVDGLFFDGGTATGHSLEIGSGTFIPGFEEQLVGMQRGETRNIDVSFPAEYRNEDLAAQDAVFEVVLHDIKRKELPTIDDEFAKEISEHETLASLRAEIADKLRLTAENNAKKRIENEVVAKVVNSTSFSIPRVLVEEEIDSMVEDMEQSLSRSKLKLEQYLSYIGKTKEALREDFRDSAANRVKTRLVIEKVAELENISVDDVEMNIHLEEMAQAYKQSVAEVENFLHQRGQYEAMRASLITGKTIDFLVSMAVIN